MARSTFTVSARTSPPKQRAELRRLAADGVRTRPAPPGHRGGGKTRATAFRSHRLQQRRSRRARQPGQRAEQRRLAANALRARAAGRPRRRERRHRRRRFLRASSPAAKGSDHSCQRRRSGRVPRELCVELPLSRECCSRVLAGAAGHRGGGNGSGPWPSLSAASLPPRSAELARLTTNMVGAGYGGPLSHLAAEAPRPWRRAVACRACSSDTVSQR